MPGRGEPMPWNKIKSMFVVPDRRAGEVDQTLKDLEKYEVPPDVPAAPMPEVTATVASLSGKIDFQALYDQAGIPNTDEVEARERFLGALDQTLPDSAKTAAAKAFLGAIGKSPKDVITDAGRKIAVVRAVGEAKRADTDKAAAQRQATIADLQRQIDEQRAAIQELQRDQEGVASQCAAEEARLQGARVFFGYVGDLPTPGR